MKLLTIVGARPQFIKAAALSFNLKKEKNITEVIVHTGQHYDNNMSEVFFDQLGIPKPNYLLDSGGKSHGAMTGFQLIEIEKILLKERPDYVLVYGDTNSTLSGALAASKLKVPIIHVEAGLRSFNMEMPEEINRIITDRLSKILFCPSSESINNLINEGYENFNCKIHCVGDIMKDTIKLFLDQFNSKSPLNVPFAICTIHRQENTDNLNKLEDIVSALNDIASFHKIIFPIHPRTKSILDKINLKLNPNIIFTDPMSYIEFMNHILHCEIVLTDSGGLQKEAFFMKKNCLVLRNETEWTEIIDTNHNILCLSKEEIVNAFSNHSSLNKDFNKPIYGDGNTAEKIIKLVKEDFFE
jgi:UDP-GlcNAc3NAcA epimerase